MVWTWVLGAVLLLLGGAAAIGGTGWSLYRKIRRLTGEAAALGEDAAALSARLDDRAG